MHIHFFGCSYLYFCCVWLHIALYSSAEVAKCQETGYSGRVRWPHHAMLTLESLLRPHNTLYTIPMQFSCILLVSAAIDLFRWNKLAKLRAEGTKVRHGKVLGNGNDKSFFQLTFN